MMRIRILFGRVTGLPSSASLIEGMACRYKHSIDSKRHILSFHIPGDIPDLQSLFIGVMDHRLGALVPTTIMVIPHERMCSIIDQYPRRLPIRPLQRLGKGQESEQSCHAAH
jgi:hypothetical protein